MIVKNNFQFPHTNQQTNSGGLENNFLSPIFVSLCMCVSVCVCEVWQFNLQARWGALGKGVCACSHHFLLWCRVPWVMVSQCAMINSKAYACGSVKGENRLVELDRSHLDTIHIQQQYVVSDLRDCLGYVWRKRETARQTDRQNQEGRGVALITMFLYLHILDLETKRMKIDNEFRFPVKKMAFKKHLANLRRSSPLRFEIFCINFRNIPSLLCKSNSKPRNQVGIFDSSFCIQAISFHCAFLN